ncbi:MAG: glutamate--tRNA ligase [Chloroflexota bacterium]|nr:glutamate--tRNA ligase [Chloroflexota bacterium]MDE2885101.1 glutamate--tRNA ligase [Chloroflexota bacterium]
MAVRVRYAPSPTGDPHVGNIRSALFNWLYARHTGGTFIVRIEDTDQARLVPGSLDAILDALRWLGLDWDEGPGADGPHGPYVQSERLDIYKEHAARLVAEGKAYECYCTPARLDAVRKARQQAHQPTGYDRRCREPEGAEQARKENPDSNPVVRFKMPTEGVITVDDFVRGEVTFDVSLLDDFVLLKSDGYPTYHLANVIDDHLMEISDVMRAEEWLPSAPRHKLLYEAFGYEMPRLIHLPLILGPDRSKLSKRHGAASVLEFRDMGYLPDALVNFLALLGWSLDETSELFSKDDLVEHFTPERILANPAVFNIEKLDWFNGLYIRGMDDAALADALAPWLDDPEHGLPASARPVDHDYLSTIVPLERERLKRLAEAPEMLSFFFEERLDYDPSLLVPKGLDTEATRAMLEAALATADGADDWSVAALETAYRALAEQLGARTGQLFGAIRVAVTGRTAAPPLFDTLSVLGKERCVSRLRAALAAL